VMRWRNFVCWMLFLQANSLLFAINNRPPSADSTLVLTEAMVDPTPAWGCPPVEYVEVFNPGPSAVDLSLWTLEIGGSTREMGPEMLGAGEVALLFAAANSALFDAWPGSKIALYSLPALSNAGGVVQLRGPWGVVDRLEHQGQALDGQAWERLRAEDCGAFVNWRVSGSGCGSPGTFVPAPAPDIPSGPVDWTWIPRGSDAAEVQFNRPLHPLAREQVTAFLGGVPCALDWLSDEAVVLRWSDRVPFGSSHLVIGPWVGCHAGAVIQWTSGTVDRYPSPGPGDLVVTEILADPISSDPFNGSEAFELWNASSRTLDLGGLQWQAGGSSALASPSRRIVLAPGEAVVFAEHPDRLLPASGSPVESSTAWPALANIGGLLNIMVLGGQTVSISEYGPGLQPLPEAAAQGLSLQREFDDSGRWAWRASSTAVPESWGAVDFTFEQYHQQRLPCGSPKGFGLEQNAPGAPDCLTVYFDALPALPAPSARLDDSPLEDGIWDGRIWRSNLAASALRSSPPETSLQALSWHGAKGELLVSLPVVRPPDAPLLSPSTIEVTELLFEASSHGEEFIEVRNFGSAPVDLAGLQIATALDPSPADWRILLESSWIITPGAVLAFSPCPLWASVPFPHSGPALATADAWHALSNDGGELALRLGTEIIDRILWSPEDLGPWHSDAEGWSIERVASGLSNWRPCPQGATPGAPTRWATDLGTGTAEAVEIEIASEWISPGGDMASHTSGGLEIAWDGGDAPFFLEVLVSNPKTGQLVARPFAGQVQAQGRLHWNGCNYQGAPLPYGVYVVRCNWSGPQGRGRVQTAVGLARD
jgi:hypothetical protein